VDAFAGSANKVISGVVDSSFGILKSFSLDPTRGGLGMLRKESGLSIRALAGRVGVGVGEEGRPLVVVTSRPGSVRAASDAGSEPESDDEEGEEDEDEDEEEGEDEGGEYDSRSIRSFESMMSASGRRGRGGSRGGRRNGPRKSLSDRLAGVSGSVSTGLAAVGLKVRVFHFHSHCLKAKVMLSAADCGIRGATASERAIHGVCGGRSEGD
jgi:hypothetical protein